MDALYEQDESGLGTWVHCHNFSKCRPAPNTRSTFAICHLPFAICHLARCCSASVSANTCAKRFVCLAGRRSRFLLAAAAAAAATAWLLTVCCRQMSTAVVGRRALPRALQIFARLFFLLLLQFFFCILSRRLKACFNNIQRAPRTCTPTSRRLSPKIFLISWATCVVNLLAVI